jgi:DNA-binding response OmpR family regulator
MLEWIKEQDPETIAIMVTGNVDVPNTIAALRGGAHDFIEKPVKLEELRVTLRNASEIHSLRREVRHARQERARKFRFDRLDDLCDAQNAKGAASAMLRKGRRYLLIQVGGYFRMSKSACVVVLAVVGVGAA